jgi:hypothetical protein
VDKTGADVGIDAESAAAPWWRRRLRIEDVLLGLWLIVIAPVFSSTQGPGVAGGPNVILGLLDLVGLLAFAACLGARSGPGVVSGLMDRGDVRYAVGPLLGAFAFTLDDIRERLGLGGDVAIVPLLLAAAVALIARFRLPPLNAGQRRALVTPFILVTSSYFGQFLSGLTSLLDLRQLVAVVGTPGDLAGTALVALLAIVAMAIFYVMLVFAPRQIADREGSPSTWLVRFALFIVSVAIGQTVGGIIRPV